MGPRSSQFRPILAVCIYTGTRRFDERFLGMSVPDKVSYFSRFTVKFVEICAASIATAVGGYLVAHLGGYLPWSASPPVPAAIQTAPNVSVVPKSPRAQPAPPIATGADEHRPASHQDAGPPPIQPARATAKATPAVPPRKPVTTGTSTADSKPDDMKSVETEVRAALEKVDAHRPPAPETVPQTVSLPPAPPAAAVEPRPAESPVLGTAGAVAVTPPAAGAVAVPPPAAEAVAVSPPAAAAVAVPPPAAAAVVMTPPAAEAAREPVQQAPLQPEPLTPVEIKSRPVAAVDASPSPQPAPPAHEENKGFLSTLAKIPEMLRPVSGATSKDPPRPPLPVGE